ncbi:SGNH/GDSL hydrolase family protein [Halioxenophilus sp. WMMB6]|uniref:SGNH/GDSL hydrolase family protein n=1 Tax=Halioxenophilus sp. WMMB6 TaxID=3073815 RepID=UPI00295EFA53|nr:SGNH/GDSL hydrolase family protein [Halioxenophilus sp. WMMB6]
MFIKRLPGFYWLVSLLMAQSLFAYAQPLMVNPWLAQIEYFEQLDSVHPPPTNAVLFLGSSSIRLWSSLQLDFPNAVVINRGFGGSEISDSVFFFEQIVAPYQPRLIIFYAGENDIAHGKTPQQVLDDFKALVQKVQTELPNTTLAFISIKPSPARAGVRPAVALANQLIAEFIETQERLVYVDVFTPMLAADGSPRIELFIDDGLHMNSLGYQLWVEQLRPLFQ